VATEFAMCTALTNGLARFIDSMSLPRSPTTGGRRVFDWER